MNVTVTITITPDEIRSVSEHLVKRQMLAHARVDSLTASDRLALRVVQEAIQMARESREPEPEPQSPGHMGAKEGG